MGWIFMIGFAALALGALRLLTGRQWLVVELGGALLLVAMAGYAWQGNPDLPGQPVTGN
ncbi:hypothetical protein [Novosphingobium sp.]|uniref:hypothetical protein n=1 Tax=Novosphingobium sp. TaxID=1874826 RepID=UPI00286E6644|nr:hypothetical protein [Novosphingobium sp.]